MKLSCNVNTIKKAISLFKPINKECFFVFSPLGMRVWAFDESQVMALDMFVPKEAFINYDCTEEKTILLDVNEFSRAFTRVLDDDFLFMTIPESANKVGLNIMKREQKRILRNREFVFPVIETGGKKIKEISFKPEHSFSIPSMLVKTAVMDMGVSSDDYKGSLAISLTKDKIKFNMGSAGEAKSKVEYHKSELRNISVTDTTVVIGTYNLKYLYDFFRAIPDDLMLDFKIQTDKPLMCEFEIKDVKMSVLSDSKPFKFKFAIAPVIDKVPGTETTEEDGLEVGQEFESAELDKVQNKQSKEQDKGLEVEGV